MDSKLGNQQGALLASVERRLFLKRGLSLGALSLLSGCDLTYDDNVQRVLTTMSKWNDGVQAWLGFQPNVTCAADNLSRECSGSCAGSKLP